MKIGSLFSGYGGLDMAVQSVLGGHVAWYSEIDKHACQVLAAHHPGVPNLGDITTVDWATVPPVDILTGGYPCQPFSHAGQRKGTDDHRHLWPYVRDALVALRPMVAVFENVDGHRSLGLDVVLGDLAALGMSARWGVVRAADAGAPHGRKRVFIVVTPDADEQGLQGSGARTTDAGRSGSRGASADHRGEFSADADGGGWDEGVQQPGDQSQAHRAGAPAISAGRGADVLVADSRCGQQSRTAATGDGLREPAEHGDPAVDTTGEIGEQRPADGSRSQQLGGADRPAAADPNSAGGEARRNARPNGERVWVKPMGPAAPAAGTDRGGHGGGSDSRRMGSLEAGDEGPTPERQRPRSEPDPRVAWGKYAAAVHRWERVLGRPAPDPTVPGPSGRPRLSPAFVEWMMGLPEGHVTGHGLKAAACLKMLGNGVVPQQAELALRVLLDGAA